MLVNKKILAGILLSLSFSSLADDECAKKTMTAEVDICYQTVKDDAEIRLNQEYQALKKRIVNDYRSDKEMAEKYSATLLSAQRNWLKYREQQCAMEALIADPAMQVHTTLTNVCITRLDEQRISEMKTLPY